MRFYLVTLGCKVNQYESQAVRNILISHGHEQTAACNECDACIINTCAVTAESARKSRQAVRRIKKESPGALIAVCGCLSQLEPVTAAELGADLIGGSGDREGFALELEKLFAERALNPGYNSEHTALPCIEPLKGAPDQSAGHADEADQPSNEIKGQKIFHDITDDPAARRFFEVLPSGAALPPVIAPPAAAMSNPAMVPPRQAALPLGAAALIAKKNPGGNSASPEGSGRTRALLKIQDGCDNYCTYCVIPFARGHTRSLPLALAADHARQLDGQGYREIVVTGIEISAYGRDLADKPMLTDALREISKAAPDVRLRLGSLDPCIITGDFCDELTKIPDLCDHFHISLQSGCDGTLRRMGRKYDTASVREAVSSLRRCFPGCGLTADLIVGFPGETDAEFMKTLDFISGISFSGMHIFPFSPRRGTRAASMPGQVEKSIARDRARIASAVASGMADAFKTGMVGNTVRVLFERERGGYWTGHSENYVEVSVKNGGARNVIQPVRITGVSGGAVWGEVI